MNQLANFGKRKYMDGSTRKNQKLKPCRDIVYTEDRIPVRKLFVSAPTEHITRTMMKKHFAMYGHIDAFILHQKLTYCYGFIQYKSVHSAAAALQHRHHFVGGFRIKVSVADSWHQPTSSTDDIPAQIDTTGENVAHDTDIEETNILILDDDCLFHIFGFLNCIDLGAVNQTCQRFQKVAGFAFRRKHKAVNLTMSDLPGYSNVGTNQLTLLQVRNLFIGHGSHIQKLHVAALSFKQENRYRALECIIRNCNTLKCLHLTGFHMKESLYKVNSKFFSNLEELTFSLCELTDSIRRIFIQCRRLRKLTIQSDSNLTGQCLVHHFPHLESITLIMNSDIETPYLYRFFKLNSQLKAMKIVHCGGSIFDDIFPRIAGDLPDLESLIIKIDYFQDFSTNIMNLLRLKKLRELQLNCSMYSIAPFIQSLAANETIEVLYLKDGILNDSLIEAISKCKKLTSLKFCSMPSFHNRFLADLAHNLPLLNDFHISKCQTLNATGVVQFVDLAKKLNTLHINNSNVEVDDAFFQSLVSIYKKRASRLTLSLSKMPVRVTSQLLEEHKQYVEIERSNEFFLYEVFGDEFSEIDSDDDDDDTDDEIWDDYDSYDDDFDDDFERDFPFAAMFPIPEQWNFFIN